MPDTGTSHFSDMVDSRVWVRDGLAIAFLLLLALLLLGRQILLGGAIYDDDMMLMSVPVYSWYADYLKQGQLPTWAAGVMGGAPIAFVIYAFFYPVDMLIYWLLDGPRAFHLSLALHLALAGICTYWYCRVLGLRRLPSLLAAVAFQMGNQVLMWQSNGAITKTLFVIPGLLAAGELMVRRDLKYWVLVPLLVGVALLVGYAQVVLFGLAIMGVYVLVAALTRWADFGPRKSIEGIALVGVGAILGLGLAAVRVAPTLAAVAESTRGQGMHLARASVDSIEPWALLFGYFLPAVTELPGRFATRPDYVGAPVLFLAALAVARLRSLGRIGWFHTGLAGTAILLSLGEYTPLYGLLLEVPFFSLFRGPDRISPAAALALGVLAAMALDRRITKGLPAREGLHSSMVLLAVVLAAAGASALLASLLFQFGSHPSLAGFRTAVAEGGWDTLNLLRPRVAAPVLALIAAPWLIVACARRWISHSVLEWSALAVTCCTLFVLGWVQNVWMPPEVLNEPPALVKTVREDGGRHRVFAWGAGVSTYNVGAFYTGQVGRPPSREFQGQYFRQFLPPNLGMLFGVDTIEWYDAVQSRRQALLANYIGSERRETARYDDGDTVDWDLQRRSLQDRLDLLAALNVKYVTHAFPIQDPRLEPVGQVEVQIYPELPAVARVHTSRLVAALPRALAVPGARVIEQEKKVLEAVMSGEADLRQEVILEGQPPHLDSPLSPIGSQVEIVEYRDDRVSLRARTDGAGYLVLMDFLLPGWSVTVNGQPEEILAANFAGRAVPLRGAGDHAVEFRYRAPMYHEGAVASILSLLLFSAVSVHALRGKPASGDT